LAKTEKKRESNRCIAKHVGDFDQFGLLNFSIGSEQVRHKPTSQRRLRIGMSIVEMTNSMHDWNFNDAMKGFTLACCRASGKKKP
jgi:hypothetical protein